LEGLIRRFYLLGALLLLGAGFSHVASPPAGPTRTERWMEATAIKQFGPYRMAPTTEPGAQVSYRMDPATYKELSPYGIVARDLTDGSLTFDVVLIASQSKASFHDPRVCFTAQGWQLEQESEVLVHTVSRGDVPVSIAQMRSDAGELWAAYCYRGPFGFAASTNGLKLQMFRYALTNERNADGVFYRFIAEDGSSTRDDLVHFISAYLDASGAKTGGYF
jgi:hypothetical protein